MQMQMQMQMQMNYPRPQVANLAGESETSLTVERLACTRMSDCSATPQPSTPALRRVGALRWGVWCGGAKPRSGVWCGGAWLRSGVWCGDTGLRSGSSAFDGLVHTSPNGVL